MKLSYRGVQYDHNPPMLEVSESDILCRYRGRTHRYSYVRHLPFPQPRAELTYRGVAYQTDSHGQRQPASQPSRRSVFSSFQDRLTALSPLMSERQRLLREVAQSHSASIQDSLERRIAVARAQGNLLLLQQLEDEMSYLA